MNFPIYLLFLNRFIGLVMICNGILNSIFSYLFGSLVKCIGRLGCFIIAAGINYSAIMLMYFWEPREDEMYVLLIIAGIWGIASAAWQSQVVGRNTSEVVFIFLIILLVYFSCLYCSLFRNWFKCSNKISSLEICWFSCYI